MGNRLPLLLVISIFTFGKAPLVAVSLFEVVVDVPSAAVSMVAILIPIRADTLNAITDLMGW